MLGMGMNPKLANEGYEEAAVLKAVQDQSEDYSPEAVCFLIAIEFNSFIYRYKGLGKPARLFNHQIIREEQCFLLQF